MLVLVSYDVATWSRRGAAASAPGGKGLPELWPAGAVFGF